MPSFTRFGVDFNGFSASPLYQMVPARDLRRLVFYNDGPDCEIYVDDPAVAGLSNFINVSGQHLPTGGAAIVDSFAVPRGVRISFTVNGKVPGSTYVLFHSDAKPGDPNKALHVSVKAQRTKTVSLISLSDTGGHSGQMTDADINTMVGRVRKYYLDQCNVDLHANAVKRVKVQKPLATPIVWDKAKGGVGDILDVLMAVRSEILTTDIAILFMWDIAATSDVGVDTLAVCLPDIFRPGSKTILFDDSKDAYVLAHEVGHALGLEHNFRTGSLMHRFATSTSSALEQFEIDTVNDDGVDG
ncbi:MAG TPA: matrixin family metalloprotease [Candidatus Sulfotelmatobacter sp.]|nr:matrixin family metalloprotease [Candidatus Sulfotelmatobacter sp.]